MRKHSKLPKITRLKYLQRYNLKIFLIFGPILILIIIITNSYLSNINNKPRVQFQKEIFVTASPTVSFLSPTVLIPTIKPSVVQNNTFINYTQTKDIVLIDKNNNYQITGESESQLRSEMNSKRPTGEDGSYDARTNWHIDWNYPFDKTQTGCKTGPVEVRVEIEFIFPEWNSPASASTELKDKWNKFIANLRIHENEHRQIAITGGKQILETLNNLPAYPTCEELEDVADKKSNEITESIRSHDREYDATTRHGESQGAVFP